MQRAYYSAKIKSFLDEQPEVLLGKLRRKNGFLVRREELSDTDYWLARKEKDCGVLVYGFHPRLIMWVGS